MNYISHPQLVRTLVKPGQDILTSLTPAKCTLLHMSSKLCSETGELMDAIGKHVYYEQPLDIENVREELGDIEFYLEGLRQLLAMPRDETLEHNITKLSKRYGEKYSDVAAKERKDKQ